ncbi:MAG: hypothetical protein GYB65_16315 [Chloroflexi bacterium]|nr:hypothetical protein [Chloroflexota bacterium]
MTDQDLLQRYNYDEFVPEKFEQWMRFDESPLPGSPAPDFPLWKMEDQSETRLSAIWSAHTFTIVEFGSFT